MENLNDNKMITLRDAIESYNIDYIDQIKYLMHNDCYKLEIDNTIYLFTNFFDSIYIDIFDDVDNIIFHYDKNNCKYIRLTKDDGCTYFKKLERDIIKRNVEDYKKIMYTSLKISGVIDMIKKEYNFKLLDAQLSKKDNKKASKRITKI